LEKFRDFVSEIVGGELGHLPQFAERPFISRLRLQAERIRFARKVVLAANVVCQFDRRIEDHGWAAWGVSWFRYLLDIIAAFWLVAMTPGASRAG
jgi:hypothetical protein